MEPEVPDVCQSVQVLDLNGAVAARADPKNAFLLKISDSLHKAIKVADVAEIARQALPL